MSKKSKCWFFLELVRWSGMRMLSAAKESDSCWSLPTKEWEHNSSWNVIVCVPPVLKFVDDIILSVVILSLFFSLSLIAARNILSEQHSRSDDHWDLNGFFDNFQIELLYQPVLIKLHQDIIFYVKEK